MSARRGLVLLIATLVVSVLWVAPAYGDALSGDDQIPGVYTISGVSGHFGSLSDTDDVFREYLYPGEWIRAVVYPESGTNVEPTSTVPLPRL